MYQRVIQTEIGPNVTASLACLCMHVPAFVQSAFSISCIHHVCFFSTCCAKMSAIRIMYSSYMLLSRLPNHKSAPVAISESNGRRSQCGRHLVLMGLVLVRAKGKMTFPLLFILGRQQEECRSSCSIPAGRSHPVNSSLPLQGHSPHSCRGLDVSKHGTV